jgi:hypothetical protein
MLKIFLYLFYKTIYIYNKTTFKFIENPHLMGV